MGTVTAAGGTVHWAPDAAAANRIVTDLVRGAGADEVVKVKSLTLTRSASQTHSEPRASPPTRPIWPS
jgi:L-lactate dehydrogenase complex protein LldF